MNQQHIQAASLLSYSNNPSNHPSALANSMNFAFPSLLLSQNAAAAAEANNLLSQFQFNPQLLTNYTAHNKQFLPQSMYSANPITNNNIQQQSGNNNIPSDLSSITNQPTLKASISAPLPHNNASAQSPLKFSSTPSAFNSLALSHGNFNNSNSRITSQPLSAAAAAAINANNAVNLPSYLQMQLQAHANLLDNNNQLYPPKRASPDSQVPSSKRVKLEDNSKDSDSSDEDLHTANILSAQAYNPNLMIGKTPAEKKKLLKKTYKQRYQQKKSIKRKLSRFVSITGDKAVVLFITKNSQRKSGCELEFYNPNTSPNDVFNQFWQAEASNIESFVQGFYHIYPESIAEYRAANKNATALMTGNVEPQLAMLLPQNNHLIANMTNSAILASQNFSGHLNLM
jgi:hypothetical protein